MTNEKNLSSKLPAGLAITEANHLLNLEGFTGPVKQADGRLVYSKKADGPWPTQFTTVVTIHPNEDKIGTAVVKVLGQGP